MTHRIADRLRSAVEGSDVEALDHEVARRAVEEGAFDAGLHVVHTPLGPYVAAATPAGLAAFSSEPIDEVAEMVARRLGPRVVEAATPVADAVASQVEEYFDGRRRTFELPLDWRLSSDGFRRAVLQRLAATVAFGETVSYGDLAAEVGNPGAARAVGGAMGSNPLPIVVPCHRVLAAGGGLGGYGGGLHRKRALLSIEGIAIPA